MTWRGHLRALATVQKRPNRIFFVGALGILVSACAPTVTEADRSNALIRHDIAVANLSHGDLRGALRELLAAVELDPTMPEVHNSLGLVYHAMGRLDDGLIHYRRAVELKPTYSEAQNNMGALLIELGRYDEAIAAFNVALADILYATPSLAMGNLGWAYYKKGDVDSALRHLRNAVAQNPKFCRGYEWLARVGLERELPGETVANCRRFEKYCAADPEIVKSVSPDYLRQMQYYMGMGYLRQGDSPAARAAFASCATEGAEGDYAAKCLQSLRSLQ